MWLIGMVVCAALMLAGHAVMNADHGSHSHERAAARQPARTASAPQSGLQPASGSHH